MIACGFLFQAEDGIRDLVRSRGLGDVYKRQLRKGGVDMLAYSLIDSVVDSYFSVIEQLYEHAETCLLYTSDAADERSSVDLGGRRIIKKKTNE